MAPHRTLPPLCAEASTVSMAPWERMPAKRRAKAIKNRQPMANPGINRRRKAADPPAPTLAGTRERRSKALDIAYLCWPNGYHVKQVVCHSSPPAHAHPVLYLPGQDDIPRSSDEESDDGTASTVPDNDLIETTAEAAFPAGVPDIDRHAYTGTEVLPAESEDMDYDAEGETDEECMEDNCGPSTLIDHPFNASWEGAQLNSMSQTWPNASGPAPTNDLIRNASEEDVRALFDGLDQFPTDFPAFTKSQVLDAGVWGAGNFGMHQLHAAVDELQASRPPDQHSHNDLSGSRFATHPAQPPALVDHTPRTPLIHHPPPSRSLPVASAVGLGFVLHSPVPCHVVQPTSVSRIGTPANMLGLNYNTAPTPQPLWHSHLATRDLVAETRAQVRSPSVVIPSMEVHTGSLTLLRRPPLRRSMDLPHFLQDGEGRMSESDEDQSRPRTPVAYDNTDIGLDETSPRPVAQAHRYPNVCILERPSSSVLLCVPTVLELQTNALKILKLSHQWNCSRHFTATDSARSCNTLSSGALSPNQRAPEEREAFLLEAWQYSAQLTEIDDNETYSQKFLDTVFARMAANRGSSLSKMVSVMEDNFQVSALNKWALFRLMDKDQFLFPSLDRHPTEYFCVGALGSALISILFKASKAIGVVFMEELCKPDNPEKCARWHAKLHDQTARKGVPPSLLAFAAAQMYWALEKLYMGSVVNFDEQHYRAIWDRYFGALLKLPHLGRLRVDMLDLIKEYYMTHWPADEPDEDEVSFPAW